MIGQVSFVLMSALLISNLDNCTAIVGGDRATLEEFPFVAQVLTDTDKLSIGKCAGAILSPNMVITTAECVRRIRMESIQVLVGELQWGCLPETNCSSSQLRNVSKKIIHQGFRKAAGDIPVNDMALLVLETPLRYSSVVQPIIVPTYNQIFGGSAIAMGWGAPEPQNGHLRAVELNIRDPLDCEMDFNATISALSTMCAGGSGKGICETRGDAGGPLIQKQDQGTGTVVLCGLASISIDKPNCGDHAQGFARVAHGTRWISAEMANNKPGPLGSNLHVCDKDPNEISKFTSSTSTPMPDPLDQLIETPVQDGQDIDKLAAGNGTDINLWNDHLNGTMPCEGRSQEQDRQDCASGTLAAFLIISVLLNILAAGGVLVWWCKCKRIVPSLRFTHY